MNEQVKKFLDAIKASDEEKALDLGAEIIGGLLSDVRRIADAIAALADKRNS